MRLPAQVFVSNFASTLAEPMPGAAAETIAHALDRTSHNILVIAPAGTIPLLLPLLAKDGWRSIH
jgi:hypothetical protein